MTAIYDAKIAEIAASRLRENDAYYIIDTAEDLENKWQKILDGKPDFIKIYLLGSENFEEKRKNIPNISLGDIGLDPKRVPRIVQKAHAAGLRVSAHVYTVTDYRIALRVCLNFQEASCFSIIRIIASWIKAFETSVFSS